MLVIPDPKTGSLIDADYLSFRDRLVLMGIETPLVLPQSSAPLLAMNIDLSCSDGEADDF